MPDHKACVPPAISWEERWHWAGVPGLPFDSQDLLLHIRGFVDHFFGCDYCREHFLEAPICLTEEEGGTFSLEKGDFWDFFSHRIHVWYIYLHLVDF